MPRPSIACQAHRAFRLRHGITACLAGLLLTLWAGMATAQEADDATQSPPAIQVLLNQAQQYEQSADAWEGGWQAALRYCEAARLGSTEAQYRLGMLMAFGRGVPESQELAAALFSVAASQGHVQAQNMLETVRLRSHQLPPCVLEDVPPPRRNDVPFLDATHGSLARKLASLPPNRRWILDLVGTQARWNAIDPQLVLSIIAAESDFETSATSSKSAMGLMQLIPETAERFNVRNAYNATQNVRGGLSYVRWLLSYYQGDVRLMLAAYNAGEKAVDRYKGVPPYKETRAYVQKVMALYGHHTHPFDNQAGKISPLLSQRR